MALVSPQLGQHPLNIPSSGQSSKNSGRRCLFTLLNGEYLSSVVGRIERRIIAPASTIIIA